MKVTTRQIDSPVALFEQGTVRVLVFRDGVLPAPVVALLGKLLARV